MKRSLFDKDRGYYINNFPVGREGDFITSPEISQLFGESVAAYFLTLFPLIKDKRPVAFVEMGAGNGDMLYDILSFLFRLKKFTNDTQDKGGNIAQIVNFLKCSSFHIIEISPTLKKRQVEKLSNFDVTWHQNFQDFISFIYKDNPYIFFVSNELFDCFSIDQFVKTDIGWCERLIQDNEGKYEFYNDKFDPKKDRLVAQKIGRDDYFLAPTGAIFEYSVDAQEFMTTLSKAILRFGGVALNFDYGYVKNDFANTLQAIKNHKKTSPLEDIYESDLTSLVNFSLLDGIAKNIGLDSNIVTQREFLTSLAIEERALQLIKKQPSCQSSIEDAIERLISPSQMGELFKCHLMWSIN